MKCNTVNLPYATEFYSEYNICEVFLRNLLKQARSEVN